MKQFLCGMIVGAVASVAFAASAAGIWENIDVLRNDIRVVVNGIEIQADNFLYNDTTYLPLRKVGEALNLDVQYDGTTNTAILSTKGDTMKENEVAGSSVAAPVIYNAEELGWSKDEVPYDTYVSPSDVRNYMSDIGLSHRTYVINGDELWEGVTSILTGIPNHNSSFIDGEYWLSTLKPFIDNLAAEQ